MSDFHAPCDCTAKDIDEPSHANPPGLPALSYRAGTYGTFLRRMLAALPMQTVEGARGAGRPLAGLDTRTSSDPAVALIDTWAVAADVLTFYQERIANEGFLRTATERRSVLELGRSVGYELAPGVAASAHLAFTVEETTAQTRVPRGTRVQSLPGQGQVPQSFETTADIEARAEWNRLRVRRTQPQRLDISPDRVLRYADRPESPSALYVKGTPANVRVGDVLLVVVGDRRTALAVHRVVPEAAAGRTRIEITAQPTPIPAALLRADLEPAPLLPGTALEQVIGSATFSEVAIRAHLLLGRQSPSELATFVNTLLATPVPEAQVFVFRQRVSFFGHNAQPITRGAPPPAGDPPAQTPPITATAWQTAFTQAWNRLNELTDVRIWTDSENRPWPGDANVFLERSLSELTPGGWVLLRDQDRPELRAGTALVIERVVEASIADFGQSAKATGLILKNPDGSAVDTTLPFALRTSTALLQSEPLELVDQPLPDPIAAGALTLMLDRFVLGIDPGQPIWVNGEHAERPGITTGEIAVIAEVVHVRGYTVLRLQEGLRFPYVRETISINANIALATHGETVAAEVLGSGDASRPRQRFRLKKPNVTYLSAPTATGVASTVSIRVNGLLFREVPTLFGQDPSAQVYALSTDNEGQTTVVFGDGQSGARLPTGTENVVAAYRTGIATAGAVGAGTLTLLQTRPLGISSVKNPFAAVGAAGPDSLEEGRANAPVAVRTLGRIVTLADYEDFARAFGGIGKAKASVIAVGGRRIVHITAVDDRGEVIERHSELYRNLQRAIFEVADSAQEVQIDGAEVLTFRVWAAVVIDPRRAAAEVLASAAAALSAAFSLSQRDLGQSVTPAEVIAVLQRVPGVIAALLGKLALSGQPESDALTTLTALPARSDGPAISPAQLLLLDPSGITLREVRA